MRGCVCVPGAEACLERVFCVHVCVPGAEAYLERAMCVDVMGSAVFLDS